MLIFIYYSGQSIYVSLGDRSLEWSRVGLDLRAVPLKALCLGGHSCQNGSNPPKSARKRQSWTKAKVEMKFYALHVFDWEAVRMCWSLSIKGSCERLNSVSSDHYIRCKSRPPCPEVSGQENPILIWIDFIFAKKDKKRSRNTLL